MVMKLLKLFIFVVCLASVLNFSCESSKKTTKADKLFECEQYAKAADLYKKKYGKMSDKKDKAEVAFKLGECYRKMNNPVQAEKWYKNAVRFKHSNPLSLLYYGDVLRKNEKYAEAKEQYQAYVALVPDDSRGNDGVTACETALKWMNSPTRYQISPMKQFNSKYSDFCPVYVGNKRDIYFSSMREGIKGSKQNPRAAQHFTDIFHTRLDKKGEWSTPVPIQGAVNTTFDEGVCSVTSDGNTMYYSSWKLEKGQNLGGQIFLSQREGNLWGQPQYIQLLKDSSKSAVHPSISKDELTLYFTSDIEGGIGGTDIWMVKRASKSAAWGQPINLGPEINTKGDEKFPYLRENGELYFASDGHLGMGGLDIFKAVFKNGKWEIENLKYPINSAGDDFGIVFDRNKEEGYFTSSRNGGIGGDDIYAFLLPPFVFALKGTVINEDNEVVIVGATVELIGSDGSKLKQQTKPDGTFLFNLAANTDYTVITTRDKFLRGKATETTMGLSENKNLEVKIYMKPTEHPIEIPNILYDLGKKDLRPESMVALDELIQILNDNPNITIELGAHTDCRGSSESNEKLSQGRAESVVNYLIKKQIAAKRLVAKGYGENKPSTVSKKTAEKYSFLKEGDVLTEEFINKLAKEEQKETAHQLNRRTEFRVLSTTLQIDAEEFGKDSKDAPKNDNQQDNPDVKDKDKRR